MQLLAIDTSGTVCASALLDLGTGEILAEASAEIGLGHAEILMQQIGSVLETGRASYDAISRIAVSIGPGSFTGVRIGMSVAQGLALGLSVPVAGVSTLDALEAHALEIGSDQPVAVILDARRDQAYCKFPGQEPFVETYKEIAKLMETHDATLCGSGIDRLADQVGNPSKILHRESVAPIATYARLGAEIAEPGEMPNPLYLRSADAKTQTGFALPRVEG
ncbi:MAG: tRNA (adenosine(37)-N6)-threonylcarbamoyltransferase complex dimerization subunit type 1 TsaB [Pseudomonadota bacterium]